jgi:tRNA dimethylallyltransferase
MERKQLYDRINNRILEMIQNGWIEEVESLLKTGSPDELLCLNALGYAQIVDYLKGKTDRGSVINKIQQNTRNYAKKQITFFRNQFPEAIEIDYHDLEKNLKIRGFKWRNYS